MKPLSERDERTLSSLASLARGTAPEPLEDGDARRMIRRAALGARAVHHARRQRLVVAATALGAAALAALVTLVWVGATREAPDDRAASVGPSETGAAPAPAAPAADPMELELPSGDRITAVEGSRFELLSVTEAERRVSLSRGAMLFDVARLGEGTTFEVETRDLRVRVVGTVFSVDARDEGTTVRVYEGRVEVLREGAARGQLLGAGEVMSSGDDAVEDPRLSVRGRRAAEARAAVVVASEEEVEASIESPEVTPVASPSSVATPSPEPAAVPTVAQAQALIAAGDPEGALSAARRVLAERPDDVPYRLVEADALRALRRFAEAAPLYDRVAASSGPSRAGAGFRAASIRYVDLSDPEGALASLDAASVDREGSPFEERGLALRARALAALGRTDEARDVAERYLARFPAGTTRADMARLASDDAPR